MHLTETTKSLSNPSFPSSAIHGAFSLRGYSSITFRRGHHLYPVLLSTPLHTCPEHNISLWGCFFMNFHFSLFHMLSQFQELSA